MEDKESERLSFALDAIKRKFRLTSLRDYQEAFFLKVAKGSKDFFIGQPTGNGKSLLFQGLSCFKSELSQSRKCCIAMVIAPLTALIEDQILLLAKKEVVAKRIDGELKLDDLDDIDVLFVSPEVILSDVGRGFLKKKSFSQRIAAVFIDESHCIEKWGKSDDPKKQPFRSCYSRLAEIRSFLSNQIPFVAMTATATPKTRENIIKNLLMESPELLIVPPEKPNVSYHVQKVSQTEPEIVFHSLFENLKQKMYSAERVIIFCSRRPHVTDIFNSLNHVFENQFDGDYEKRPYAMFHSTTEDEIMDHVVKSFQDPNGSVRLLISTVAFGMGMDCKNLHHVIHFGPPPDLDDYFQESGRAGRDGKFSVGLLLTFPYCFTKHTNKNMKEYCRNQEKCRREILLDLYGSKPMKKPNPIHKCCDFCYQHCECGNCEKPNFYVDSGFFVEEEVPQDPSDHENENENENDSDFDCFEGNSDFETD